MDVQDKPHNANLRFRAARGRLYARRKGFLAGRKALRGQAHFPVFLQVLLEGRGLAWEGPCKDFRPEGVQTTN